MAGVFLGRLFLYGSLDFFWVARHDASDEGTEDGQIFQVFVEVFGFWGFEAAGVEFEARVVDDVTEGFFADFALADAGVAIDAGAEVGFGIV